MANPAASRSTAAGIARSGDIMCALAKVRMTLVACERARASAVQPPPLVPIWTSLHERICADRSIKRQAEQGRRWFSLQCPRCCAVPRALKISASSDAPSGEFSHERSTLASVTSCTGGCTARAIVPAAHACMSAEHPRKPSAARRHERSSWEKLNLFDARSIHLATDRVMELAPQGTINSASCCSTGSML